MNIAEASQLFDTVMNEKSSGIERCSTGIRKILGHNSLQMMMDLYCHVRESTLTDEMERIANFI